MKSDMGTEKRILIFVILTLGFFILYGYLVKTLMPPPSSPPPQEKSIKNEQKPQKPSTPSYKKTPIKTSTLNEESWAPVQAKQEQTFTLDTRKYRIVWSNRGGVPLSWKLKEHRDTSNQPLEMIPQVADPVRPFVLVDDKGRPIEELNDRLFVFRESSDGRRSRTLEFEYADDSVRIVKRFEFQPERYDFRLSVLVQTRQDKLPRMYLIWGPGLENTDPRERKAMGWSFRPVQGIYYDSDDHNVKNKKDTFEILSDGPFRWVGVHSNFFLATFVGDDRPIEEVLFAVKPLGSYFAVSEKNGENGQPNFKDYQPLLMIAGVPVPADQSVTFHVFVGPKDIDELTRVDATLSEAIQYGFFGFFSRSLLVVLKFCYQHIYPNYGLAIILVTILLRILLWPLSHKMFINSERMKAIQPKIKQINEKYKKIPLNDPRRKKMNEELMKVYSEHGVNPLSGCLPMLVQLPILFGFYRLLSVAIELRGAPFILWIKDLSRPDPYLITPILMGISMILQQKLSPTTVDPKQQRLTYIFSVVFTFMFANAQSGLVLYWLFNNVLSILQQQFYHRYLLNKAPEKPVRNKKKKKALAR